MSSFVPSDIPPHLMYDSFISFNVMIYHVSGGCRIEKWKGNIYESTYTHSPFVIVTERRERLGVPYVSGMGWIVGYIWTINVMNKLKHKHNEQNINITIELHWMCNIYRYLVNIIDKSISILVNPLQYVVSVHSWQHNILLDWHHLNHCTIRKIKG